MLILATFEEDLVLLRRIMLDDEGVCLLMESGVPEMFLYLSWIVYRQKSI